MDLSRYGEEKLRVGQGSGKDFERSKVFVHEFSIRMRGFNISAF